MDIIEYFVKHPRREFYVRELAKLTGKSPTTVSKRLKDYSKKGVLTSESKFNHLLFRANLDNEEYMDIRNFYLGRYIKSTKSYGLIIKKSPLSIVFIDNIDHIELAIVGQSISKFDEIGIPIELRSYAGHIKNKEQLIRMINGTKIFGTIKI